MEGVVVVGCVRTRHRRDKKYGLMKKKTAIGM